MEVLPLSTFGEGPCLRAIAEKVPSGDSSVLVGVKCERETPRVEDDAIDQPKQAAVAEFGQWTW